MRELIRQKIVDALAAPAPAFTRRDIHLLAIPPYQWPPACVAAQWKHWSIHSASGNTCAISVVSLRSLRVVVAM